jgi:hypothetical protein
MTEPDPIPDTPAGPLSGLLVADFSRALPYCTMLLASRRRVSGGGPGGGSTRQWCRR